MHELSSIIKSMEGENRLIVSSIPSDLSSVSEHVSISLNMMVIEHGWLSSPPVVGFKLSGWADSTGNSLGDNFEESRVVLELSVVPFVHVIEGLSAEDPPPVVVHVVKASAHEEASGIEVLQREFS